jgi:hypothetical protein
MAVVTSRIVASVPLLFGFAPYRGRRRVLDLQPAISAARAIRRAEALRHDALAAEHAGVLVDDRAVGIVMLIVGDACMRVAQELGQLAFALLDRHVPQVLAVEFEQVESAEHGGGVDKEAHHEWR